MKNLILYFTLIILLVSCIDSPVRSASNNELIVSPRKVLCGEISTQKPYYSTLHLKNISQNKLLIDTINVSCECVKILDYDSVINSHHSGQIKFELNTDELYGNFERKIIINYHTSTDSIKVKIIPISGKGVK